MKKTKLLLPLILVLLGIGVADAQTKENPWTGRFAFGTHSYDGDVGNEILETSGSDFIWSLGATRYLSSYFNISFKAAKMKLDYTNNLTHNVELKRGTSFGTDNFSLNLSGQFKLNNPYMLSPDARFKPYFHGGVGMNVLKHDYGITEKAFSIPYGFGINYRLSSKVMLNYEFTYNRTFNDHIDGYPSEPGEIDVAPEGRPALDNRSHDDFLTNSLGFVVSIGKLGAEKKRSRTDKLRQQSLENMAKTQQAAEKAREAAEEVIGAAEKAQMVSQQSRQLNEKTLRALRKLKEDRNQTEKISKELRNHLLNIINNIEFEFDSSSIASNSYDELKSLATVMKDYPRLKVRIEGHADKRGDSDYNMKLSRERAKSVKRYLVKQGASGNRITTAAYGENKPDMGGDSPTAYTQNRYVELIFH